MSTTLQDIEALVLTCRSQQSKEYVAEAVRCYKAGAYRAAIVNTWIAVVFDLIDKIRELSLSGDPQAKALENQYETYLDEIEKGNNNGIKLALEFEREILGTCKSKLQFFDSHQYVDLVRLKEDRHRCAHPSFQRAGEPYSPSAEHARLHLRNAICHVLSQPPVQGKAAISELKLLVSSSYFPTNTAAAVTQLRSSPIASGTDSLVRGFIDALVFGFFTKGDPLFLKPQVIYALNAAQAIHPAQSEDRLRKHLSKVVRDVPDDLFSGAAMLIALTNQGWNLLEEPSKNKILEYVNRAAAGELMTVIEPLSHIADLAAPILGRVDLLSYDELAAAIADHKIGGLATKTAIRFISGVRSWSQANDAINKLLFPIYEFLSKTDIENIIKARKEHGADLPGATAYEAFIDKVRLSGVFSEDELNGLLSDNGAAYLVTLHKSHNRVIGVFDPVSNYPPSSL